jgi:predicted MFS family arabinose efflux permease
MSEIYREKIQIKVKKKLKCDSSLVVMCLITLLSNCAYALIAPFLPLELKRVGIPTELFGYIFSMYSVAVVICSPFIGFLLTKFKRRNFV